MDKAAEAKTVQSPGGSHTELITVGPHFFARTLKQSSAPNGDCRFRIELEATGPGQCYAFM